MSDLKSIFEKKAKEVLELPKRPNEENQLKLYAFYKQAIEGDVTGKRPPFTSMIGRPKFDARNKLKGMDSAEAMKAYIALVEELQANA